MTNPFALLSQPHSSQITHEAKPPSGKVPSLRVLSTIAWLVGVTAILAGCSSTQVSDDPTPIPTISGESVTPKEVENYAKAVLAIEQSRRSAFNDIQQILKNGQIPDINCTQSDTLADLPNDVKNIAVKYCNQSKKIGESQGLTMPQFNAITVSAQSDSELKRRIQNELIRLQRS